MTDLILWRHGQTDYNSQGRIQGRVDVPLNETGRDQARRAAEDIAALGPTRIVSSPLTRARDTAEALASLTGLSVEIDEGLAEKSFGDWEGLKAADIKKQWPEHYATWRAGGDLPQFRIEGRRQTAERVGRRSRPPLQVPRRTTSSWPSPTERLPTWGPPTCWGWTPSSGSACVA